MFGNGWLAAGVAFAASLFFIVMMMGGYLCTLIEKIIPDSFPGLKTADEFFRRAGWGARILGIKVLWVGLWFSMYIWFGASHIILVLMLFGMGFLVGTDQTFTVEVLKSDTWGERPKQALNALQTNFQGIGLLLHFMIPILTTPSLTVAYYEHGMGGFTPISIVKLDVHTEKTSTLTSTVYMLSTPEPHMGISFDEALKEDAEAVLGLVANDPKFKSTAKLKVKSFPPDVAMAVPSRYLVVKKNDAIVGLTEVWGWTEFCRAADWCNSPREVGLDEAGGLEILAGTAAVEIVGNQLARVTIAKAAKDSCPAELQYIASQKHRFGILFLAAVIAAILAAVTLVRKGTDSGIRVALWSGVPLAAIFLFLEFKPAPECPVLASTPPVTTGVGVPGAATAAVVPGVGMVGPRPPNQFSGRGAGGGRMEAGGGDERDPSPSRPKIAYSTEMAEKICRSFGKDRVFLAKVETQKGWDLPCYP
ncbi:hypothetical protein HYV73_03570 [Candidatus Uhrbacteria bacterium]|nr:hypothetical protein [Candidatus Uhrbacteria bacterium]